MNYKNFLYLNLLIGLLLTNILAQEKDSSNQTVNLCNSETALQLVDGQVIEAKKKTDSLKLIKVLTRAGEFTWDLQNQTAREYYQNAFDLAVKRFEEKGFEEKVFKSENGKARVIESIPDYRFDVVRSIAKKDGVWARKLTKEIIEKYKEDFEKREKYKLREPQSLLTLAAENYEESPNLSRYLVGEVMKLPLDRHWFYGLGLIANKDINFADEVYTQLIANYQNETPNRLILLSAYPFARLRIMGHQKYQFGWGIPKDLTPNIRLQEMFVKVYLKRILEVASNPENNTPLPYSNDYTQAISMASGLQDLEPYIRDNLSNYLPTFNIAKAKAESLLNAKERTYLGNLKKRSENPLTFEDKLKRLKKLESEGKLQDYNIIFLILGLKKEEQFEALEIWLEKIKDEKLIEDTTNLFYFKRSEVAIKAKDFDLARKYADKVPELEFRGLLYFKIVQKQSKIYNESPMARSNLIDVSALARNSKNSVAKAQVQLGLAHLYEKLKQHSDALDEIGNAVKVINSLEEPNIFSSFIAHKMTGKNFALHASYATPGYNMETAFREISKNDYDLTLAHAQSLQDQYFQTLAVLAIAKNCVENSKKKEKLNKAK